MHPARKRLAAAFTTIYDHVMAWCAGLHAVAASRGFLWLCIVSACVPVARRRTWRASQLCLACLECSFCVAVARRPPRTPEASRPNAPTVTPRSPAPEAGDLTLGACLRRLRDPLTGRLPSRERLLAEVGNQIMAPETAAHTLSWLL